ncbi:hypothetical protein GRF29_106g326021 [Pseudopithomyces chartarum]|uniref:DNA-directed RNA polymerase subunit n=1 Tax=Pseudopithomyces chartarum TaxID=1892770 RepID=A0AAN6RFG8_9PLEO|nr:hypothetical protein GRF29_106g326021 [Pseudopithomyces chartarum]
MAPIQSKDNSLLYIERISQYVPLPPASLTSALPAICAEVFSPLLLTYYAPVRGVILAYTDASLSTSPPKSQIAPAHKARRAQALESEDARAEQEDGIVLTQCVDEYMAPFVWATASLVVWRPSVDSYIEARLTHQSATHVTLSHLNTFAVTVLKENFPAGWAWKGEQAGKKKKGFDGRVADEGGSWVDSEGVEVSKGRELSVRVREWDVRGGKGKGVLRVEGSLLSLEEEKSKASKKAGKAAVGRSQARSGEVMEVD